jgi:hypothetical protein
MNMLFQKKIIELTIRNSTIFLLGPLVITRFFQKNLDFLYF